LWKIIHKPLQAIGRFFLLALILPFYKNYLALAKQVGKFYAPHKSRHHLIHPFSRRYLNHIIIGFVAFFTLTANLNANEVKREDFGQTSVVASLFTNEDLGLDQQEGPVTQSGKTFHYFSQTGVSTKPQIATVDSEEEIIPFTVAGDSALIEPILSPVEQANRQRDKIVIYIVQPGDTISQIAGEFGISASTILWENNLTAYSIVRPDDKLTILPVSGIRHKVAKGETISKIAKKYGVTPDSIIDFNKLASINDINIGEQLMIPGGKKIVETPTYTLRKLYPTPSASTQKTAAATGSGRMVWPNSCRRISQYFGWRHSGLDIACSHGVAIFAADSGRVIKAQGGWNGGYGNYIIIDHGNGLQTVYGHLSAIYVQAGESVGRGQVIGAEGTTGRSTGPHLHFEVRSGGARRNPLSYIR